MPASPIALSSRSSFATFDAGSAAASTALRDDWLAALRAAVAAAQADDAASGTV